jgi:pyoverdine/dityrosine biosynthesis protein Dit1
MKLFLVSVVLAALIVLAGCGAVPRPDQKITIFSGGNSLAWCVRIDSEMRVAYDCNFTGIGHADEIHLGANDTWSVSK